MELPMEWSWIKMDGGKDVNVMVWHLRRMRWTMIMGMTMGGNIFYVLCGARGRTGKRRDGEKKKKL